MKHKKSYDFIDLQFKYNIYFFLTYIACLAKFPQYKPHIKIKPIIEMPTIKKYFLDGDDDISLYISPKFSITFN